VRIKSSKSSELGLEVKLIGGYPSPDSALMFPAFYYTTFNILLAIATIAFCAFMRFPMHSNQDHVLVICMFDIPAILVTRFAINLQQKKA
jgi:hypothetical protein